VAVDRASEFCFESLDRLFDQRSLLAKGGEASFLGGERCGRRGFELAPPRLELGVELGPALGDSGDNARLDFGGDGGVTRNGFSQTLRCACRESVSREQRDQRFVTGDILAGTILVDDTSEQGGVGLDYSLRNAERCECIFVPTLQASRGADHQLVIGLDDERTRRFGHVARGIEQSVIDTAHLNVEEAGRVYAKQAGQTCGETVFVAVLVAYRIERGEPKSVLFGVRDQREARG
jgi:hypothetical protein